MNSYLETKGCFSSGWLLHRENTQLLCAKHAHSSDGREISPESPKHGHYQKRAMGETQHSKVKKTGSLLGTWLWQLIMNLSLENWQREHDEKRLQKGKYQSEFGKLWRFWIDCLSNMEHFLICTLDQFSLSYSIFRKRPTYFRIHLNFLWNKMRHMHT